MRIDYEGKKLAELEAISDRTRPTDIKLKLEQQQLVVAWGDGVVSTYELGVLRRECPCASCAQERKKQREELFHVFQKDPGVKPIRGTGCQLVGNYALRLEWSDGHNTGMYDYRFLRALAEAAS